MEIIEKMPLPELIAIVIIASFLVVYGVVRLIITLKKVKRQKAELKKLVSEYEDFLRERSTNK